MNYDSGGKGAYTKGLLSVYNKFRFHLYLGGKGEDQTDTTANNVVSKGGWNFGGDGGVDRHDDVFPESGAGGGGGVDIRLNYFDVNFGNTESIDFNNSINSRIMCAGSGGGSISNFYLNHTQSENFYAFGSPGGTASYNIGFPYSFAGNQTSGQLGIGGKGAESFNPRGNAIGGGGSGYRGGWSQLPDDTNQKNAIEHGGPGGSSYISGHPDCISPGGGSIHPSNIVFKNPFMIAGDESMPSPFGGYMIGNSGPGVAKITYIEDIETYKVVYNNRNILLLNPMLLIFMN